MAYSILSSVLARDPDNWIFRAIMWIVTAIGAAIYWILYVIFVEFLWKFTIVGAWDACVSIVHGDMPPLAKAFALILVVGATIGGMGAAGGK